MRLPRPGPRRAVALAASATLALAVVAVPWFALGDYRPDGWEATAWARGALILALANLVAAQIDERGGGSTPIALAAVVLVGARVAFPPDFGFDFDGLEVGVERLAGAWIALGAAVMALAAAAVPSRRVEAPPRRGGW